jgi:hypothetical protein
MDSAHKSVPYDAAALLGPRPIPEELIRGLGTCVFSRNIGHFGLICGATTGFRWNLTFILTDSLYGYAMKVYAKGEVQRLRRWRATAAGAPSGPYMPLRGLLTHI